MSRQGHTLDDVLRGTATVPPRASDADIEHGREAIGRKMERMERDSCHGRPGMLQGALQALAEFSSVYGVLDSEEAFVEAARAAWKAKTR